MVRSGFWVSVVCAFGLVMSAAFSASAESVEDKAALCAACHGDNGVPVDKAIPTIWGQQEGYIYIQLRDFKKGARQNELMTQVVAPLEREDMRELAAYFAAKPWPRLGQARAPDDVSRTAMTANSSVGCTGCHLEEYQGTGTAPRLAGQSRDYLAKTLAEFRSGVRANNPGMTSLMKATAESDLAALETYLAGL